MKMWVARAEDNKLTLHASEPEYWEDEDWDGEECHYYWCCPIMALPEHLFPEVTFENSPMEVELKLIDNGNNG